jgi:hypothetical protein
MSLSLFNNNQIFFVEWALPPQGTKAKEQKNVGFFFLLSRRFQLIKGRDE